MRRVLDRFPLAWYTGQMTDDPFPYEVVILNTDGTITEGRALFRTGSDAVAFAEIRPGYYGSKWIARRRSDGREIVPEESSKIEGILQDVFREKTERIMDAIRPLTADASLRREIRQAVKDVLHSEGKRKPNWMALGHGTRLLDILE